MPAGTQTPHVVIVGGGVAGLSACCDLVDAGCRVTLIERRERLGGRATSLVEPSANGELIDNCQHVLLGCCTALIGLYRRLGVLDEIEFFDRLHFIDNHGRRGNLYSVPLPAPLHLGPAMACFPLLSGSEKRSLFGAMRAMKKLTESAAEKLDAISFGIWLKEHQQSQRVIDRFWNVIVTSALNESATECSARYATQVFRNAFLGKRDGWRMGISRVPLSRLYEHMPAERLLMGKRVTGICPLPPGERPLGTPGESMQSIVLLSDGQTIACDAIVLAVAPDAAKALLAEHAWAEPMVQSIQQLTFRPIIGAHYFYDRPVLRGPHLAFVGCELDWLFRKDASGCHVQAVVSNAGKWAALSSDEILNKIEQDFSRLLPWAKNARRLHGRLIREQRATFSPLPGLDAHRLDQKTPSPTLFIAGDYTQTDWPATMEGAAISGRRAANAALADLSNRFSQGILAALKFPTHETIFGAQDASSEEAEVTSQELP